MTLRTLLVLGTAALAVVAGVTSTDLVRVSAPDDRAAAGLSRSSSATWVPSGTLKRVDAIELDAESITLRDGRRTVAVVSMRDARTTVRVLTRLLGTPSRTQTAEGDGGRCFPASTTSTWGGAVRVAALATPSALGNSVEVRVLRDDVRTRTGAVVELQGPHGVQVGDDVEHRIEHADSDDRESLGSDDAEAWQVLLEEGWPSDRRGAGTNGVSALTDDTTVTVIGSPMPVHATRGC
ncbi:hypothetical protein BIU98_08845 [Curtobacterium sp. MMLR14_010]|uniref:hypothetical protein n=1 Tax=Curtobacterium sp. MMLR14_010 TaxID=1898743 RepID=UPI0008DDB088|nr:hypothetical protein [Curtobacterium sp. MMLR14_010]OII31835.1 hypothetical protein BIU98_08845 [Curtobacterium sp. MMLR14_010]